MRLIIFILSAYSAVAAIASTTQWDVRTTGNDANGGGFNTSASGTNYAMQDSPQVVYTDLVIGATTTQATSAANPFDSTSPGNVANIVSGAGCTVQRAQVVSVAAGVATFDKSLGTAASTCSGNFGGGLLTVQAAVATTGAVAVNGNTINIKDGTYSSASTINVGVDGMFDTYKFVGYGTTWGDGGTRPLITTASNVRLINTKGNHTTWRNINFSSTAGTRNDGPTANASESIYFFQCRLDGFRYGIMGDNGALGAFNTVQVFETEIMNSGSGGIYNWYDVWVINSYIHDNTGFGLGNSTGRTFYIFNSILTDNSGPGVSNTNNPTLVIFSSVIANNTGDGVGGYMNKMVNNIIYGNGGYGVNLTSAPTAGAYYQYNAFGSNTSGARNNFSAATGDVTLTADPFTNAASGDYSPNSTAGGGAAVRSAGYPGAFPGGTTTGYMSIGAVIPSSAASAATLAYPFVQ